MIEWQGFSPWLTLPLCVAVGLGLGFVYFRTLRATAALIVNGGHPLLGLALTLGRLAGLGAAFYLALQVGGLALLAMLAGLLSAKYLMLRKIRRAST